MASITVLNPNNNEIIWNQDVSKFKNGKIPSIFRQSEAVGLLAATLKPVRTDSLRHFSKDFFLPTVMNYAVAKHNLNFDGKNLAWKVATLVIKFFFLLGSLVLDVVTFPIRFITCIPTAIVNHLNKDGHPVRKFLQEEQKVDSKSLDLDAVKVKCTRICTGEDLQKIFEKNPKVQALSPIGKNYTLVMTEFLALRKVPKIQAGFGSMALMDFEQTKTIWEISTSQL